MKCLDDLQDQVADPNNAELQHVQPVHEIRSKLAMQEALGLNEDGVQTDCELFCRAYQVK